MPTLTQVGYFILAVIVIVAAFILLRELIDVLDDDTPSAFINLVTAAVTPMDAGRK
jgi:hypothetical protein